MTALDIVVCMLAAGAAVNAWLMKGGLFATWRDTLHAWGEPVGEVPTRADDARWLIAKLFNCRICLTYHVAFWLLVLFYLPSQLWLKPPWDVVWLIPVYALAVTRLSLLIGTITAYLNIEGDPEND